MEQKTVVIAGGRGALGQELAKHLQALGYRITIISRRKASSGFPTVCWDSPNLSGVVRDADVVINLAGENLFAKRWTSDFKSRLKESRFKSTETLATLLKENHKPQIFVSASAIGYYGFDESGQNFDEGHQSGQGFLAELAEQWEALAGQACRPHLRVVNLRIGVVLGPKEGAFPRMKKPIDCFVGGVIGSGRQTLSWIHQDDLCRLVAFLITKHNLSGPVNAVAPDPISMKSFLQKLAHTLKRPLLFPVPAMALRGVLGEVSDVICQGQKVHPKKALESGFCFDYANASQAIAHLCKF